MIQDTINTLLLGLAKEINEAILENNFETITRTQNTVTIKVLGEEVAIWMANKPTDTECFRINLDDNKEALLFPEHTFKKPGTCRNILRKETKAEEEQRKENIRYQIEQLKGQL